MKLKKIKINSNPCTRCGWAMGEREGEPAYRRCVKERQNSGTKKE